MLQQEPQFSPLLAHAHAKQLRQVLIDNDRLLVLVGVASARGSRHVYSWTLRRQQGGWLDGVSLECYKGCWMTESVIPHSVDHPFKNFDTPL
mmetsp:Transcript_2088/g.8306  ORF Transcript_2088/g.8306 Transcript_2088/m.8306 type:complete len:92 (+) Transcript_2088:81-356(+)